MKKIKFLVMGLVVLGSFLYFTDTSNAANTCSLSFSSPHGSQIYVSDRVTWTLQSDFSGGKSYWFGTKNGTTDVSVEDTTFGNPFSWTTDPYPSDTVGNYTRWVQVNDINGNFLCQTPTVFVSVVTAPTTSPITGMPTATLTANSTTSIIVKAGDPITYSWSSQNAITGSSQLAISPKSPDPCGNANGDFSRFIGGKDGTYTVNTALCQAGYTYTIYYTSKNSAGVTSPFPASVTIEVVSPTATTVAPAINQLSPSQGMQGQTVDIAIKGFNFTGANNYSMGGVSPVSDRGLQLVSSQFISDTQINAKFSIATDATVGTRNITVSTPNGTSNVAQFSITAATITGMPTATLTTNDATSITVKAGDPITYSWSSQNAITGSSQLAISPKSPDPCGNANGDFSRFIGGKDGTYTVNTALCQAGYTYTIYYTSKNSAGVTSPFPASVTIEVVSPTITPSPTAALNLTATASVYPNFKIGDAFSLVLNSNQYSQPFYLCSNFTPGTGSTGTAHTNRCTATTTTTNSSGGYNWTGTWDNTTIGTWTEWVMFPNTAGAYTSPTITFAITPVTPTSPVISQTQIGPYFWDGTVTGYGGDSLMSKGLSLAKELGAKIIRIYMGARSDIDYKDGSCISNFSLADLAARSDFKAFLSEPQFNTVLITAYDGASFGDCNTKNYLNPDFYTAENTAKIEKEYADFANYLKQFPGKKFIILNWEGDGDTQGIASNLEGYKKWLTARYDGIHSSGATNVFSGVEFGGTLTGDPKNVSTPNVLRNVIPFVSADYYSYSSYVSINVSPELLASDINTIKSVLSSAGKDSNNLIIGEYGFKVGDFGDTAATAKRLGEITDVVTSKALPYAIVWNLLDIPAGFGLYDTNGNLTKSGEIIKQKIVGLAPAPAPSPIPGPVDQNRIYSLSEIYNGDLIREQGGIAVWIVKIVGEKRYKRWLFGPQIFSAYGHLGFNKVKNTSKATLNNFDTSNLIRKFDDAKVYELTDFVPGVKAVRRWIPSVEVFFQRGFDFDAVYIVNQNEFDLYTEGSPLPLTQSKPSNEAAASNPAGLTANISDAMFRFLGLTGR